MARCGPSSRPPNDSTCSIADPPGTRMRWWVAAIWLAVAGATAVAADPAPCPEYVARPERTGRVPAPLAELSGFAASRIHRGVFWAHNDSGNAPDALRVARRRQHRRHVPVARREGARPGGHRRRAVRRRLHDELHLPRRHRRQRQPPPGRADPQGARADHARRSGADPRDPAVPLPGRPGRRRGAARRPAHRPRLRDQQEPAVAG